MKIQITNGKGWYEECVGAIFEIVETDMNGEEVIYYVDEEDVSSGDGRRFVNGSDCTFYEEDISEKITLDGLPIADKIIGTIGDGVNGGFSGTVRSSDIKTDNAVEHPSHYTNGRFETIEMIEEVTKGYSDGFVAHCVGTSVKYNSRAPFKGNLTEDLKKSRAYLTFAIDHIEGKTKEDA